MTNDFLQPGRRCNKMYKTEPRFYEILFITNTIKKRNGKYNMSTCDRKIAKDECEQTSEDKMYVYSSCQPVLVFPVP